MEWFDFKPWSKAVLAAFPRRPPSVTGPGRPRPAATREAAERVRERLRAWPVRDPWGHLA